MTERENFDPREIVRRVIEKPTDKETIKTYELILRNWNWRCALAIYTDNLPLDQKRIYFKNIGYVHLGLVE